ncbi:hypothetical protein ABZ470_26650 [Streptosporangium sp. NPDC020072]|uniref:hypothetical protein n=1 Tax=Streptosporangium sp. NPDC020072 TaxID=3154788 RepID=UPI00341D604E
MPRDPNDSQVERRPCPSCGTCSRIITRGDSRGTIVSKCCEATLDSGADEGDEGNEPEVLIENGTLVCPWLDCRATDNIVELDVASRENVLYLSENGVIAAHLGDSSFENDGFECLTCNRAVSIPDAYEIIHS